MQTWLIVPKMELFQRMYYLWIVYISRVIDIIYYIIGSCASVWQHLFLQYLQAWVSLSVPLLTFLEVKWMTNAMQITQQNPQNLAIIGLSSNNRITSINSQILLSIFHVTIHTFHDIPITCFAPSSCSGANDFNFMFLHDAFIDSMSSLDLTIIYVHLYEWSRASQRIAHWNRACDQRGWWVIRGHGSGWSKRSVNEINENHQFPYSVDKYAFWD